MGTSTRIKIDVKCLVLIVLVLNIVECRRVGGGKSGGRRPASRPPSSRPVGPSSSNSHSGTSGRHTGPVGSPNYGFKPSATQVGGGKSGGRRPASRPPSSRPVGPSSSNSHSGTSGRHTGPIRSPNYGFKPSVTQVGGGKSGGRRPAPRPPSNTVSHPSPSSRPNSPPFHFKPSAPNEHATNSKPIGNANTGTGHSSSHGATPTHGFKPSAPITHGSGSNSKPSSQGSNSPPIGFKPSVTQGSSSNTHGSSSNSHGLNPPPFGFKPSAPNEHATNSKPLGNANPGTGHSSSHGATPPPYGFKPSAPIGPPTNVKPVGNLPPGASYPVQPPPYSPHNPGIPPPAYNPAHNPAGYGPPPAYNPSYYPAGYRHAPAYNPGYGHPNYPQQQYHPGGYGNPNQPHYTGGSGGITNININNNNNHHYGGGYGGGFGGGYSDFGYHYPSYHYTSGDTGNGTVGFFLGYSLAKVITPTYHSHSSFYNGYTPRYDHYEVHHYYHNRVAIPAQSTIQPNTIVGCIGDSGTICPKGTTSLCTNNGAILCVASASTAVPCTVQKQGNCIKTTIPCVKGTADCEVGTNKIVTIPCISSAKVPGNITYVNNTIIVNNTTIINNNFNGTMNETVSKSNSSTVMSISSTQNDSIPLANLADSALKNISANRTLATSNTTTHITTTTEVPTSMLPIMASDSNIRTKIDTPPVVMNEFCVTILALPAERKPTEQEQVLSKAASIFTKFLVKALGVA